jgi:hypothetical protein
MLEGNSRVIDNLARSLEGQNRQGGGMNTQSHDHGNTGMFATQPQDTKEEPDIFLPHDPTPPAPEPQPLPPPPTIRQEIRLNVVRPVQAQPQPFIKIELGTAPPEPISISIPHSQPTQEEEKKDAPPVPHDRPVPSVSVINPINIQLPKLVTEVAITFSLRRA